MEDLITIKTELQKILSNFKKSINRGYSEKTLKEKEERVTNLHEEARKIASSTDKAETVIKKGEEYALIKNLTEKIRDLIEEKKGTKMTFDIKTGTALLQPYNGKQEDTEAFIESMELLDEITPEEDKQTMIKFIKIRITGKAKYAITEGTNTVDLIKKRLRSKFSSKLSSDAILAQLRTCQQGSRKLADFSTQIENLCGQLTRAFVAENVATSNAAEKLAEKFAIQTFTSNIASPETSIILKASNFTTLSEITAKAIAVDKPQASNVLHYHTESPREPRFTNNNRQKFSNGQRYNNGQRFNNGQRYNNNGYNSNRYLREEPNRNHATGFRSSYQSQRNYRNSNNNHRPMYRQQNNNISRRVNYCNSGEGQPPQPEAEVTRLGDIDYRNLQHTA